MLLRRIYKTIILCFVLMITLSFMNYGLVVKANNNSNIILNEVATVEVPGILFDVALENNYAYLAEYSRSKFHIINITDPFEPSNIKNFPVNLPHYIDVQDGIAYISAWTEGVQIYNVSNPFISYKISEFRPGTVAALMVQGDLLFVGSDYGFNILDITNPAIPQNLSYFFTDGNTHDFFVVENLLYAMAWNWTSESSWIRVIDFTNPEYPIEVGHFDLESDCYDIHVLGDYVYVAASYDGIKIINFKSMENPYFESSLDLPGRAFALEVYNNALYLGNGYSGLHVIDVSDVTSPYEITYLFTGGYAEELEIRDDFIYIAVENLGLKIIQIQENKTTNNASFNSFESVLVIFVIFTFSKILRSLLYRTSRWKK